MCVGFSNEHTLLAPQAGAAGCHPRKFVLKMSWVNEGWLRAAASSALHFTVLCTDITVLHDVYSVPGPGSDFRSCTQKFEMVNLQSIYRKTGENYSTHQQTSCSCLCMCM